MWRHFKFLHMTDVEKCNLLCCVYNLWHFVAFYTVLLQNYFFFAIYAVLSQNLFTRFTRYCLEKILAKKRARGEKMTNIRYAYYHLITQHLLLTSTTIYI